MFGSAGEILRLGMLVWNDPEPLLADAVYLFGVPPEEEDGILSAAASLYKRGVVKRVLFDSGPPYIPKGRVSYPGFDAWQEQLFLLGVPKEAMFGISRPEGDYNTLVEAENLVCLVSEKGWHDLIIVTSPAHLIRAFTSVISVLARSSCKSTYVYAKSGYPLPWHKTTVWSQGTVTSKRVDILEQEVDRLHRYHDKGDLISCSDVLRYLESRDSIKQLLS